MIDVIDAFDFIRAKYARPLRSTCQDLASIEMVSVPGSSPSEASPAPESVVDNRVRTRALTARQERKLVEYVEDGLLDVMRNYKKR